jgi:hypothetical protein
LTSFANLVLLIGGQSKIVILIATLPLVVTTGIRTSRVD